MDTPILVVFICMGKSIIMQRVKYYYYMRLSNVFADHLKVTTAVVVPHGDVELQEYWVLVECSMLLKLALRGV